MSKKVMLGRKVRRLRRAQDLSQVELAKRLGISASYLNLIEHNQRPLTLPLLIKLAEKFDIDLQAFSQDEEARLLADLREMFGDPFFGGHDLGDDNLNELVDTAPAVCRGVLALYRAYRKARDDIQALGERLSDEAFLSTSTHELRTLLTSIRSFSEILHDHADLETEQRQHFVGILVRESQKLTEVVNQMVAYAADSGASRAESGASPADEVTDFVQQNGNYFPLLEEAAEACRAEAKLAPEEVVDATRLAARLSNGHRITVELASASAGTGDGSLRWFDPERRVLYLSEALPAESRRFQIARQIAESAFGDSLEALVAAAAFEADGARALGRDVLANHFAAALLMPYDVFLGAAQALRYDIERLQHRFGTSFEQTCHRLVSLQRHGAKGIPFHFMRVDIAGNVSKRFSASGLQLPRYGGICARLGLHAAFLSHGQVCRQISGMPDGSVYFGISRSLSKPGGYNEPQSHFAIGLGCELSYAPDLVYGDGLDLAAAEAVVPAGITCRLCERLDCRQRAFAPILPSLRPRGEATGSDTAGLDAALSA